MLCARPGGRKSKCKERDAVSWYLCLLQAQPWDSKCPSCFCYAGHTLPAAEIALDYLQAHGGGGGGGALNKDRGPVFGL